MDQTQNGVKCPDIDPSQQEGGGEAETSQISETLLFMLFLLLLNEILIQSLNKWRQKWDFLKLVQTSSVTTLIGIIFGILLHVTGIFDIVSLLQSGFSSFFTIVFLPAILYEGAINMEKQFFFKNLGSILLYAILGTIISIFASTIFVYLVALTGIQDWTLNESFAFSSLISATDPVAVLGIFKEIGVDKNLFILIFGESILNDAVSIILFNTSINQGLERTFFDYALDFFWILFGSMFIGILTSLITAYFLRDKSPNKDQQENKEQTTLLMVPFVSYLIAESASLSGIVSIVFCGITMARYTLRNVSANSKKMNQRFFHTLAYNFENVIFLFIGIGFVGFDLAWKQMGFFFFLITFLIIQFARYLNIVLVTALLNKYRIKNKINEKFQFFLWFSGFRGAMAFALSMQALVAFKEKSVGKIMLTITMCLIIINIFINATLLLPLVKNYEISHKNKIKGQNSDQNSPDSQNNQQKSDLNSANQNNDQQDIQEQQTNRFWNRLKEGITMFDEGFLQKLLFSQNNQNLNVSEDENQNSNYSLNDLNLNNNFNEDKQGIKRPLKPQNSEKNNYDNQYDDFRKPTLNFLEDEEENDFSNQNKQNQSSQGKNILQQNDNQRQENQENQEIVDQVQIEIKQQNIQINQENSNSNQIELEQISNNQVQNQ